MPQPGLADILIGDTIITPQRRFPSSNFSAAPIIRRTTQRSQSGKLFAQTLFQKYEVQVDGLSLNLFEDLRREYERDQFIDLSFLTNRKEFFSGDGSQTVFLTTRRMRLDDANVATIVETPPGTIVTAVTLSNTSTQGKVTFTTPPSTGTNNIVVRYFPIISGLITEFDSTWNWVQGEEDYTFTFSEA